jgi:acyl carrier protein
MMSREETLVKISSTLRTVFSDKDLLVTEATSAKDIGDWDSLNHITVISSVEKVFNVKFSLSEIVKLQNVGSIIDLVQTKSAR